MADALLVRGFTRPDFPGGIRLVHVRGSRRARTHYISECWICCAIRASVVARADRTAGSLALRREFQKNVSKVLSGRHEEAVRNARWNMNDIARC